MDEWMEELRRADGLPARSGSGPGRLLPLVVVLACVATLSLVARIALPKVAARLGVAQTDKVEVDLVTLASLLDAYAVRNEGRYPADLESLLPQLNTDAIPLDPWGRPYLYDAPAEDSDFNLRSLGADGVAGGVDADRDIDYRSLLGE